MLHFYVITLLYFKTEGFLLPLSNFNVFCIDNFTLMILQDVPRWLFKIDNEFSGRGHAYFDVHHIKIMHEIRSERDKYRFVVVIIYFIN